MDKKIFYLTICAFGFSLAGNLQIANFSTILQFVGIKSHLITYLWLIPPLTGLLAQPVIGILSESISTPYGRRLPLFLLSMLLGVCSLIFIPFTHNYFLLIFLIILLYIGLNGSGQLASILVLDLTKDEEQTKAFSWLSAIGGFGALFGCMLPLVLIHFFHFSNKPEYQGVLPRYIQFTFIIGACCYLFFSLVTLLKIKENKTNSVSNIREKIIHLIKGSFLLIKKLPDNFWKLSYVLFFAWIAVFSVWNYLNLAIAQTIFHMPIVLIDNIGRAGNYLARANVLTSSCFAVLQLASTLFAFFIPHLNKYLSLPYILTAGLFVGGVSLLLITLTTNQYFLASLMVLYGVMNSILTVCPVAMFGKMIPNENKGYYMGIFNIAVVLPQIIMGLLLGMIYKYCFANHAVMVIFMAGCFLLIASMCSLWLRRETA